MKKIYRSDTVASVNVVLPSGKNKRISFSPRSDGGSTYLTDDKGEQYALEHHYRFGSLFHAEELEEPKSRVAESAEPEADEPTVVKVTDLATAKDWLAENLGLMRSSLKSRQAILSAAEARGIVFEGI